MEDLIAIIIIALILTGVIFYIINAKHSGQKCIGCPYSKTCGKINKKSSDENCCVNQSCCNKSNKN